MKTITKILSLMLIFTLSISMMACSSYGKVEKALTDLGYAVVENSDQGEQYKDDENITNVYIFEKSAIIGKKYVTVLEFKSTEKLVEYFNESDTLKGLVSDLSKNEDLKAMHAKLEEYGLACDNCLIFSFSTDSLDIMAKIAELNK